MSITFLGPAGSCELRWIQYALLCDNVLHHLERLDSSSDFGELHRVGDALGGPAVAIPAQRLREALIRAQALCTWPIEQLATSALTKAILFMQPEPKAGHPTEVIGPRLLVSWAMREPKTLGDVFGNSILKLLAITNGATEEDIVEVIDS